MQYNSVLQSTTPVLLCTTKYYASTFLCYNVLLRYYKVLKSTTPVLLCITKSYSSPTLSYSSTTTYYPVLLQYYASTTKYYSKVLRQYYLVILQYYFVTSFIMRGATRGTIQLHQILRLPHKKNLVIDRRDMWNDIYNARSNKRHPPTSPKYCACPAH